MKILITAPSLAEAENVSGISTVVRQIIQKSPFEFSHFAAGRRDGEKIGLRWFYNQAFLFPNFFVRIKQESPDLLHLNTALTPLAIGRDAVLAKIAQYLKTPILLHIHGGKFFTQGFSNNFYKRLIKKMLYRTSAVVVLSETEKEFIEKIGNDLKIHVLPNAVSFAEIEKVEHKKKKKKTILFLGRFHKGKGLKEIRETCRILKNKDIEFRFEGYGAGEEKDSFVRQMTEILGKDFYYGGVVSGREKWKALSDADVFLLPSHYEGLPLALLEAMAAGCVAVASDVGSIGKVIEDGKNGFLIRPRDTSQIVEKMEFLFSGEADWENLQRNAEKTIEERFSIKDYVKSLETIYEEII